MHEWDSARPMGVHSMTSGQSSCLLVGLVKGCHFPSLPVGFTQARLSGTCVPSSRSPGMEGEWDIQGHCFQIWVHLSGRYRWLKWSITPMADTFFRSKRLAGTEAMVPPAKPTTTILPSHARLRRKRRRKRNYKKQCIFIPIRMATIKKFFNWKNRK